MDSKIYSALIKIKEALKLIPSGIVISLKDLIEIYPGELSELSELMRVESGVESKACRGPASPPQKIL